VSAPIRITPAQTAGPFLHIGMLWPDGPNAVADDDPAAIVLTGRIVDGAGDPVADALVETWQADAEGRFASDEDPRGRASGGFRGWARSAADDDGRWRIVTVKPGTVPGPDGSIQAPHVDCTIHARGLLRHLFTRIYFADEREANAADPVLGAVDGDRRATLLATPTDGGYELDIRLQGDRATVFFDA
jgi:protocatechuate 3,4-dioxygenase alpha subunit